MLSLQPIPLADTLALTQKAHDEKERLIRDVSDKLINDLNNEISRRANLGYTNLKHDIRWKAHSTELKDSDKGKVVEHVKDIYVLAGYDFSYDRTQFRNMQSAEPESITISWSQN